MHPRPTHTRHRAGRPLWAALLSLTLTAASLPLPVPGQDQLAWAQQDRKKAKQAYTDARKAYDNKDFATAAELFKQAYNYDPKPQLLFNIGQSLKEAGELDEAVQFYTRYLEEIPDAPNRDQVLETIFTIQQEITARLAVVHVNTPQPGFDVFINQEPSPRCQTPCDLDLNPGTWTLTLRAEGFQALSQELTLEPQDNRDLNLTPQRDAAATGTVLITTDLPAGVLTINGKPAARLPMKKPLALEPGPYNAAILVGEETRWSGPLTVKPGEPTELNLSLQTQEATDDGGSSGGALSVTGFTLMGLGAGSILAGGFFGLSASSIQDDLVAQRNRNEKPNNELIAQGESQALNANLFYGVGALALVTGLLLWVFDDSGQEQPPPEGATLLPDLVPTDGGAAVRLHLRF
jgi:tetratricopeptide (TPR) repeat protein